MPKQLAIPLKGNTVRPAPTLYKSPMEKNTKILHIEKIEVKI